VADQVSTGKTWSEWSLHKNAYKADNTSDSVKASWEELANLKVARHQFDLDKDAIAGQKEKPSEEANLTRQCLSQRSFWQASLRCSWVALLCTYVSHDHQQAKLHVIFTG